MTSRHGRLGSHEASSTVGTGTWLLLPPTMASLPYRCITGEEQARYKMSADLRTFLLATVFLSLKGLGLARIQPQAEHHQHPHHGAEVGRVLLEPPAEQLVDEARPHDAARRSAPMLSAARSSSGLWPTSQAPTGRPKPCFCLVMICGGRKSRSACLKNQRSLRAAQLQVGGQAARELDHAIVEQRERDVDAGQLAHAACTLGRSPSASMKRRSMPSIWLIRLRAGVGACASASSCCGWPRIDACSRNSGVEACCRCPGACSRLYDLVAPRHGRPRLLDIAAQLAQRRHAADAGHRISSGSISARRSGRGHALVQAEQVLLRIALVAAEQLVAAVAGEQARARRARAPCVAQ